jgi:chondroitin 4-sulfotransferase 11
MISHELRCIFVHVQKTGGSSVRGALQMAQFDAHKHRFAIELRAIYGADTWNQYFKFAFVRNPWDRLVSWWEMMRRNVVEGRPRNGFQRYVMERARTFAEFLQQCDTEYRDADGTKWIYRNQVDYLRDRDEVLLVDFVGRFEQLQLDFTRVAARLNVAPITLPHVNGTVRRPYTSYYSRELRELVAERYAKDIEAFGYRFAEESDCPAAAAQSASSASSLAARGD